MTNPEIRQHLEIYLSQRLTEKKWEVICNKVQELLAMESAKRNCYTEYGIRVCYCGKCKLEDYPLPKYFGTLLDQMIACVPTKPDKKAITIEKDATKLDCLGQGFSHCRKMTIENIKKLRQ